MTENEAFLAVMMPGDGEITREEFEKVKHSIGRLWHGFWMLRHLTDIGEEDWSKEIVEMIEACGGLDNAREKWEALKRKRKFVLSTDQKHKIVRGVRIFLEGVFVDISDLHGVRMSIKKIMETDWDLEWNDLMKHVLTCLGADKDELQDKWWEEENV